MAVRVYYGTCDIESTDSIKQVVIHDTDIISPFELNEGDLLSVYFLNGNEANYPSLVLYNGDPNEETSTIINSGKFIKNQDIDIDMDGVNLWKSGETLLFCYTNIANSNTYCWEIVNRVVATTENYGITILNGEEEDNISDWLKPEIDTDYSTAVTPGILKKLASLLLTPSDTPGSEPSSNLTLSWNGPEDATTTLGTLSLNIGNVATSEVTIDYTPINNVGIIPTKTSDLINDGPDPNKANVTTNGHYYLTNILPDNSGIYHGTLGNISLLLRPYGVEGGSTRTILYNTLQVGATGSPKSLFVTKNLDVAGTSNLQDEVTAEKGIVITNGGLVVGGKGGIDCKGNVKALEFFENTKSLKEKYSGKLTVESFVSYCDVNINSGSGLQYINTGISSTSTVKHPLGIVGYVIDEPEKLNGPSYCHFNVLNLVIKDNNWKIAYGLRNYWQTKPVNKLKITFKVLVENLV